jgi:hypothetical protein
MKNLILPSENQVKANIEHFLKISGSDCINLENMYLYFKYTKGLITGYFEAQGIEFNKDNFFEMYHLYTLSDTYFQFVKL